MPAVIPALDTPIIRATRILELLFHRVLDGMMQCHEIVRSTGYRMQCLPRSRGA